MLINSLYYFKGYTKDTMEKKERQESVDGIQHIEKWETVNFSLSLSLFKLN